MDHLQNITDAVRSIDGKIADYTDKTETRMREFADELLQLKQRGFDAYVPSTTASQSPESLIAKAITGEMDNLQKTRQLGLQVKAFSGTPIGSAQAAAGIELPGLAVPGGIYHGIVQVLPMQPIGALSNLRYVRENVALSTGGVGVQAGEGAAKSWFQPGLQPIDQTPITVAGLTKITEQSLRNSHELGVAIETLLRRELALKIDTVLLKGNTTPAWPGLLALATAVASGVFTEPADAVQEAIVTMELLGALPSVSMLAGSDWLQIALDKGDDGHYKADAYLRDQDRRIGKAKVGLSPEVTPGDFLMIDPAFVEIYVSQNVNVQLAYVNDDFEKNLISMRVETEILPVLRSTRGIRIARAKPAI